MVAAMKIAIIGTGIAGNVAAYMLRREHDLTVFEANNYVGGHTNTIDVYDGGQTLAIDTGFIVFNDRTYPNFIRLLDDIGQESQASDMSFSIQAEGGRIEYCGSSLNSLFAQRRNIVRPAFYRMLRDVVRFNRVDLRDIDLLDDTASLQSYLLNNAYSEEFTGHYLVPMAAAIWSAEPRTVLEMPVKFLIRFFANHGLLQLRDRPVWRVIKGGSRQYVDKLIAGHRDRIRLAAPVQSIRRCGSHVEIYSASGGREQFDAVFVACHSNQALALLKDGTRVEREVLGAIRFQSNEAILHSDVSLMPKRRRAWAAWNYHIPPEPGSQVAVTYNMNILQGLEAERQFMVSLNSRRQIEPQKIVHTVHYDHPVYSRSAVDAQQRQGDVNSDRTFFCGAYWRNGFHEDGVVSAVRAVEHFQERLASEKLHLRRAS
jgi:predicted NAD/FAD-binding protein